MLNWIRKLSGRPVKPCHVAHEEIKVEDRLSLTQELTFCAKCSTPYLTEPRLTARALQEAA